MIDERLENLLLLLTIPLGEVASLCFFSHEELRMETAQRISFVLGCKGDVFRKKEREG